MPGPLYTHSVNGKRLGRETKRTNEHTKKWSAGQVGAQGGDNLSF
jgi:hypothetical protein